jgi:iron complex transport system permease protein
VVIVSIGLIAALMVLHVGLGTVSIPADRVVLALLDRATDVVDRQAVWDLRLPRTLIALIAGAMLGLSGALLQSVMRNPLAEPGLTGVSAGGVLVGVIFLTGWLGLPRPGGALPLVVLVGCLLGGAIVWLLGTHRGRLDPVRLVVAAVIVNAALGSLTTLFAIRNDASLGAILPWIVGSLNGTVWADVALIGPWAAVIVPIGLACARPANIMLLGDDLASSIGLRVAWVRTILFVTAATLAAAAVCVVGAIAFVGLMAPNAARLVVGADARRMLLVSLLFGAVLLLAADTVAQTLTIDPPFAASSERAGLPVGAVLALIGGPVLVLILRRTRDDRP